jgi:uncharacterized membrane protein YkoI
MSQRMTILIAAGLTAFLLVVGGAVAGQFVQPTAVVATTEEPTVAPVEAAASPDVQAWMEREAAYQELIRQANEKLQQAYAQQAQVAATSPAPDPALAYAVSPEQAAEIALQAVPGAVLLRPAELVNFQGVMAYEVALDKGMVYVDANTGEILYNSTVIVADDNSSGSGFDAIGGGGGAQGQGSGHEGGGGHEGGDDGGDD